MKNWKRIDKYYTFKNDEKSEKWFLKSYDDFYYGKHYFVYMNIIYDNILKEITCTSDMFIEHIMTDEEYNFYNSIFEKDYKSIKNFNELKFYALKILNIEPKLTSQTLMASTSDNMIDNPNWFSGIYRFPDGNYYTIILHKGIFKIFPGKTNYTADLSGVMPLISFKINLKQWADKITKDSNIIIEEINE